MELLSRVGVERPDWVFASYPSDLSAILAKRVQIAHALSGCPDLLVVDNPTQTLIAPDRAGILNLLRQVQREDELTMILVTPSVAVAASTCHRVAVLRAGAIVEYASVADLFASPKHPYSRELLSAAENEHPGSASLV